MLQPHWSTLVYKTTRVLWNTYPVHLLLHEICETQLIAEEDYIKHILLHC